MDRKGQVKQPAKIGLNKTHPKSSTVVEFPRDHREKSRRSVFLELLERGSQ